MPRVYDSADPNLPNIPEDDDVSWSDYDDLLARSSDFYSSSSDSLIGEEDDDFDYDNKEEDESFQQLENAITGVIKPVKGSFTKNSRKSTYTGSTASTAKKRKSKHRKKNKESKKNQAGRGTSFTLFNDDDESPIQTTTPLPPPPIPPQLAHHQQTDQIGNTVSMADLDNYFPRQQDSPTVTPRANTINPPAQPPLQTSHESPFPTSSQAPSQAPSQHKHKRSKRRSRKYTGSKIRKERVAWEPGIDVNTTNVVLHSPGSSITITDYSETRYRLEHFEVYSKPTTHSNKKREDEYKEDDDDYEYFEDEYEEDELEDYAGGNIKRKKKQNAKRYELSRFYKSKKKFETGLKSRPSWSKVRWINVNALSWETISLIAEFYDLHRLAIEDMVDIPQRTKVDIYSKHLFIVLPLLKLVKIKKQPMDIKPSMFSNFSGSAKSSKNQKEKDKKDEEDLDHKYKKMSLTEQLEISTETKKLTDTSFIRTNRHKIRSKKMKLIESRRPLNMKGLGVGIEQTSMYLTGDNTVITFFEHSSNEIEKAILYRLSSEYTILRESCDSSILLQSILDSIIDLLYPVITAYNRRLNEFEIDILTNPTIQHTQELHLMINELTILKSNLLPISNMINQLRDHKESNFKKFISENSKLYLNDIFDHLLSFIDEIESMSKTIENLVNLIFNTLSVETNDSMQQLSLITVIFLPLSFWAGYFGMNFESFGDLEKDVGFYWKLTIPFTVGLIALIMWKKVLKQLKFLKKLVWNTAFGIDDGNNFGGVSGRKTKTKPRTGIRRKKTEKTPESLPTPVSAEYKNDLEMV